MDISVAQEGSRFFVDRDGMIVMLARAMVRWDWPPCLAGHALLFGAARRAGAPRSASSRHGALDHRSAREGGSGTGPAGGRWQVGATAAYDSVKSIRLSTKRNTRSSG